MLVDTLIYSDHIFTSTTHSTIKGAIGIVGDEIVYVGDADNAKKLIGPSTNVVDHTNDFVCPGFHDNHLHFIMSAMAMSRFTAECTGNSPEECIAKMKAVEDVRPKDKLMFGFGWYHPMWEIPHLPNKQMLDEVYPDRPVAMQAMDGHTMWCNTCALDLFGITNDSIPPKGGIYQKDEDGNLTGIIQEQAATGLLQHVFKFTDEELEEGALGFLDYLAQNGITSVCDMAALSIPGSDLVFEDLYKHLYDQDKLTCRMHIYPQGLKDLTRPLQMKDDFGSNKYLQLCGLKQFFDGVSPSHTAWLHQDYVNAQFEGDRGNPVIPVSEMYDIVENAAKNGLSVRIHTIGDAAISAGIDIFKEVQGKYGKPSVGHNGLEHLENLMPSDIDRLAKYDICANVQPPHMVLDMDTVQDDLGVGRTAYMWPFNTFIKAGVTQSFGSDSPVVDINSREVLYCAITRKKPHDTNPNGSWEPEETVRRCDAIRAYTYGSAYSCGRQDEIGTLEEGKLADIVILDTDLINCSEDSILNANVLETIVGGKTVYKA